MTWNYRYFVEEDLDEFDFTIEDDDTEAREKWIRNTFSENIRDRVFILHTHHGIEYYFNREEDYKWFLWRWS